MSFSFSASGTPGQCIATVGKEAANQPDCPQAFADAINLQLSALPDDAKVSLSANGSTKLGTGQTRGTISLGVTIDVVSARHPDGKAEPSGPPPEAE
jgi:hypothetical protein